MSIEKQNFIIEFDGLNANKAKTDIPIYKLGSSWERVDCTQTHTHWILPRYKLVLEHVGQVIGILVERGKEVLKLVGEIGGWRIRRSNNSIWRCRWCQVILIIELRLLLLLISPRRCHLRNNFQHFIATTTETVINALVWMCFFISYLKQNIKIKNISTRIKQFIYFNY